ncbi:hypothetical protein D3C81_1369900 [compost metagenome]
MAEIKERVLHFFEEYPEKMCNELGRDEIDTAQIIYSYLHHNNCHYVFLPKEWLIEKKHTKLDKALREFLEYER